MPTSDATYLHWVKRFSTARWNLVNSGILAVKWAELGVDPALFEITGDNGYGWGPLVERIAARYSAKPENVVIAQGASLANFLVMGALLKPGDQVLMESPCYEPLYRAAQFLGAELRFFDRRFEDGYRVDPDRVARALTRRTRLVALTNLHNPTGVFLNDETLRRVGEVAARVGAWVLVDEAYQEFIPNARPAFHLGDRFISTNSLTKVYGLGGLRCGWVLASAEVAEHARRVTNCVHGEGVLLGEIVSCVAFDRMDWLAERTRLLMAANRPVLDSFLQENRGCLECVPPDAGTICFPRLRHGSTHRDASELALLLRQKYETSVVAGHFFAAPPGSPAGDCAHHLRLSFGSNTDTVREGLARVSLALTDLCHGAAGS